MAYTVNGKVRTQHPLMDEIVYNSKKILAEIVVKNDDLANQYEDELSLNDFEILKLRERNRLTFNYFPFTEFYYRAYGFNSSEIPIFLDNRYAVPENMRDSFLKFCINWFENNFEEKNDYYRSLMGLPPYNTDNEYYIPYGDRTNGRIGYGRLLPKHFIRAKTNKEGELLIDTKLPLHKQTKEVINVLQDTGGIKELRKVYRGFNYSYILHLADKSIDVLTARKAAKWEILYMPKVETLVQDKFEEFYYLNRDHFLKSYYQDAYKYDSIYYDQTLIFMLLSQTFNDMIVDTPEWYIRRDIFDIRSVQYFLDSNGVAFFPEIPMKYQIKIVKNLNRLIKYKSTNRNSYDILDIFGLKGTAIYKYYLFKRRQVDEKGEYIESEELEQAFELLFIATELYDTYDNYIKDNIFQTPYDDITLQDKYWDGEHRHDYVRHKHLEKDFTLEGTKYMSVEYKVSMEDYLKQQQFFVGLMFSSNIDMEDFTIIVPAISETTRLKISNIFLFLLALTDLYEGIEQVIVIPDDDDGPWELPDLEYDKYYHIMEGKDPSTEVDDPKYIYYSNNKFNESHRSPWMIDANAGRVIYDEYKAQEDLQDWKFKWYGEHQLADDWLNPGMNHRSKYRIYGFNNVDKEKVANIIDQRHSMYGFNKGYTLEQFSLDKYINPCDVDINNIDDLVNLYNNNIVIYEDLKDRMSNNWYDDKDKLEAYDHDDYKVMEFLFRLFFTKPYDKQFYMLSDGTYATKYSDLLRDRDFTLYNVYYWINRQSNMSSKKEYIRNVMNDTLDIMDYYFTQDNLDQVFAFTATASHFALLHYMHIMINFFKSYKVHFIDPYVTYVADDRNENSAQPIDNAYEKEDEYERHDKMVYDESYFVNDEFDKEDTGLSKVVHEIIDVSGYFDPDPLDDYIYDGMTPFNNGPGWKMADGRYPEDRTQFPYIVLNGGNPQLHRVALWYLDGGKPKLYDNEYLVINGGHPFHAEDIRRDYFGFAYHYIMDGGYPRFCQFISSHMSILVEDHQIYANVMLSRKGGNKLEVDENGALIVRDQWTIHQDLDELVRDTNNMYTYYNALLSTYADDVHIIADDELINARIVNNINRYVGPMQSVLEYKDQKNLDAVFKPIVDVRIDVLNDEFGNVSALGKWTELQEEDNT